MPSSNVRVKKQIRKIQVNLYDEFTASLPQLFENLNKPFQEEQIFLK